MTKDFPWYSKYPAGIPHEIGPLEYQSLIELYEVSGENPRKIAQVATGADGRADVIASGPLPLGKYGLRFVVGDYLRKQGAAAGKPAFLDFVPIRFAITDPTGHYHIPLIFWPWGYTTYRGS